MSKFYSSTCKHHGNTLRYISNKRCQKCHLTRSKIRRKQNKQKEIHCYYHGLVQSGTNGCIFCNRARNSIRHMKDRAKRQQVDFKLSFNDIVLRSDICYICNDYVTDNYDSFNAKSVSIDRIVPENGYVLTNIKFTHFICNTMKYTKTVEQLLQKLSQILLHHQLPSKYGPSTYINKISTKLPWKRGAAKRRRIEMSICVKDCFSILFSQQSFCALCGDQLTDGVSIDRIDSNGTYSLSNIQLTCSWCNVIKWRLTHVELLEHIKKILSTHKCSIVDII